MGRLRPGSKRVHPWICHSPGAIWAEAQGDPRIQKLFGFMLGWRLLEVLMCARPKGSLRGALHILKPSGDPGRCFVWRPNCPRLGVAGNEASVETPRASMRQGLEHLPGRPDGPGIPEGML
jgi:hypothetical protein